MKKISYIFIAVVSILFFWFILGVKYTYNDETNAFSKLQCVSYAPFDKEQSPFDSNYKIKEELVKKDLQLLSKYTECIRTYATVGLEIIPKIARENNLKMYMGAWVSADPKSTQKELDTLIKLAKENSDIVKAVIVGNEVLLRREISENKLFDYVKYVKENLPNTKVTYADVWEFWLKYPSIKNITDFVTIHILPYWEDEPKSIEDAIKHLESTRIEVEKILGSSKILIGETGWPSEGRMREEAFPSKINQAKYVRDFVSLANKYNWDYNIIEAFDQPWKRVSEGAVGGHWGLFDKDRNDKNVFKGEVSNFSNYIYLLFTSLILFTIFSAFLFKYESSKKQIIQFSYVNTVFAILFTLQIEQYFITVRTSLELLWASLVLVIHLYVYYLTLINILNQNKQIVPKNLFYCLSSLVAINSLVLALDGRYQNFEIYIFLISAYFIYTIRNKVQELELSSFTWVLSLVLLLTSILIVINEKLTNIYSNIWVLISLLFVYVLFKANSSYKQREITKVIFSVLIVTFVFFIFKYFVYMNDELTIFCNLNTQNSLCKLRETISYLLYIKVLGFTSLFFLIIGLLRKKSFYFYVSLFFSIASLILFNVSIGAFCFVASIFFLIRNIETKNQI